MAERGRMNDSQMPGVRISQIGAAAGRVMHPVVVEAHCVTRAQAQDCPVMMAVARGAPRCLTVEFGVGDGHAPARLEAH